MKKSTSIGYASLWLCILLSMSALGQETFVSGQVVDSLSNEGLPFASISLLSGGGTTTNGQGRFSIKITPEQMSDSLMFSYMGYRSQTFALTEIASPFQVSLGMSAQLLGEVVVRPQTAEEYLKVVIGKVDLNYADSPFNTMAYYKEDIKENGEFLAHSEGVFDTYYDSYGRKAKTQHQLILHREKEDVKQLEFMAEKAKKEKEKYLEEHPEDSTAFINDQLFAANFGGPASLLDMRVGNPDMDFIDSTMFRHFRYAYGPETTFSGKEVLTVTFESKGTVENVRSAGILYINKASDAVIAFDYSGDIIIPLYVRPILFALGLAIKEASFEAEARLQEIDGRWYPKQLRRQVRLGMVKKHLFKENQRSSFDISQLLSVYKNELEYPYAIAEVTRYKPEKPMKEQVRWDGRSKWSEVDIVD